MKRLFLLSVLLLMLLMLKAQSTEKVSFLLKADAAFDAKAFVNAGGELRSRCGDIYTAWIPADKRDKVLKVKGIVVAEPARAVCPLLYKATQSAGVNDVWNGVDLPQGFDGKDVIVGVTDWGFDYTHPVFYDTNLLEYRVLRAWDQYKNAGPAPQGFAYGTEWNGKEQLLDAQCDTDNIYHHHYHATHVASMAAGAGAQTKYRGVAPAAQLLFVTFQPDEAAFLDACNWMKTVSQEENKRLVVNMSWGLYHMDNLDGTGLLAQALQYLVNQGIVFVTSGGNNGDVDFHLSYLFENENDTMHSQIGFDTYGVENYLGQALELTSSPNDSFAFAFAVYNSSFQFLQRTPFFATADGDVVLDTFLVLPADTVFYKINIERKNLYNARPQARLQIRKPSGNYRFALCATASSGEFHAWNVAELTTGVGNWGYDFSAPFGGWVQGDARYGLGMPANADACITVAAHRTGNYSSSSGVWNGSEIAYFSSHGPTLDGRLKPEVSAPGCNVIAALSSYTDQYTGTTQATVSFNGRDYAFIPLSGTSMSSPFVTGVVALLLQANPFLSPAQVKRILCETALWDSYAVAAGQERFGYGKVDAYAAVQRALAMTGTETLPVAEISSRIYPNPCADQLHLQLKTPSGQSAHAFLYDMAGHCLWTARLSAGVHALPVADLPAGCYFVKVLSDDFSKVEKIIKL